jgi:hypothetical protein
MTLLLEELAGCIGAALLLAAYGMVSFKKLRPDSLWNRSLNAAGSGLLIVNTVYHRAFPSAFVNVIWILIAVVAQMRALSMRKRKPHRIGFSLMQSASGEPCSGLRSSALLSASAHVGEEARPVLLIVRPSSVFASDVC